MMLGWVRRGIDRHLVRLVVLPALCCHGESPQQHTCPAAMGTLAARRRRGRIYYKCHTTYDKRSSECRGWAIEATKLDDLPWVYCNTWSQDPGVLVYEVRRTRPQMDEVMQEDRSGFEGGLAAIGCDQRMLARRLRAVDDATADTVIQKAITMLHRSGHQTSSLWALVRGWGRSTTHRCVAASGAGFPLSVILRCRPRAESSSRVIWES